MTTRPGTSSESNKDNDTVIAPATPSSSFVEADLVSLELKNGG